MISALGYAPPAPRVSGVSYREDLLAYLEDNRAFLVAQIPESMGGYLRNFSPDGIADGIEKIGAKVGRSRRENPDNFRLQVLAWETILPKKPYSIPEFVSLNAMASRTNVDHVPRLNVRRLSGEWALAVTDTTLSVANAVARTEADITNLMSELANYCMEYDVNTSKRAAVIACLTNDNRIKRIDASNYHCVIVKLAAIDRGDGAIGERESRLAASARRVQQSKVGFRTKTLGVFNRLVQQSLSELKQGLGVATKNLFATGHVVVLSQIERLDDSLYFDQLIIEATGKVYIDRSLTDFHGKNVLIKAPLIEVVGAQTIDISGRDAGDWDPPKAGLGAQPDAVTGKDGKHGVPGDDGEHGKAGESGGNLYVLAGKVIGAANLTVISNGGDGGNAQMGGDGENGNAGEDGKKGDPQRPPWYHFTIHYLNVDRGGKGGAGGKGGDGGGGGKGGLPGHEGRIDIELIEDRQPVSVRMTREKGMLGQAEDGGKAGLGGKPGKDGIDKAVWCNGWCGEGEGVAQYKETYRRDLGAYASDTPVATKVFASVGVGLFAGRGIKEPEKERTEPEFDDFQSKKQETEKEQNKGKEGLKGVSQKKREEATHQKRIDIQSEKEAYADRFFDQRASLFLERDQSDFYYHLLGLEREEDDSMDTQYKNRVAKLIEETETLKQEINDELAHKVDVQVINEVSRSMTFQGTAAASGSVLDGHLKHFLTKQMVTQQAPSKSAYRPRLYKEN